MFHETNCYILPCPTATTCHTRTVGSTMWGKRFTSGLMGVLMTNSGSLLEGGRVPRIGFPVQHELLRSREAAQALTHVAHVALHDEAGADSTGGCRRRARVLGGKYTERRPLNRQGSVSA